MTTGIKAADLLTVHVVAILKNSVEADASDADLRDHQMARHFGSLLAIDTHAARAAQLNLVAGRWPDLTPTTLGRRLYTEAGLADMPEGRANAWPSDRLDEIVAVYVRIAEEAQ